MVGGQKRTEQTAIAENKNVSECARCTALHGIGLCFQRKEEIAFDERAVYKFEKITGIGPQSIGNGLFDPIRYN